MKNTNGHDERPVNPSEVVAVEYIGSRYDTTKFYRTGNGITVICGCFMGTLDEFKTQVAKTHGDNKYAREYKLACQLAELHIWGGGGIGVWIKMEDRMPEEDCQILCSNGSDICLSHSNLLTRHADDDALYAPALYGRGLRVLYWMPVPPLPEGCKTE